MGEAETPSKQIPFKAETSQLLNILIHSLYTEREVFLRELISNASDALTRMDFELLTNRHVLDPDRELAIWVRGNPEENTITIEDAGIGMTAKEMEENLGTIAHSGAQAFLKAAKENESHLSEIIGQFGVGFYAAFMVADWIEVKSRSYKPGSKAAKWTSTGTGTYTVEPAEKEERGTIITVKLKEDAKEFAEDNRLRQIIRRHSDFIPYPIYLGEENQQANQVTALWRQQPRKVEEKQYEDFYQQMTLDFDKPLTHLHLAVDAPVQMYAILYVPSSPEKNMFSPRQQVGLKLYARKVLIQEYSNDFLPEYLQFIEGVVDSEDLPLNVSRETVQANRVMMQLRKLITAKVIEMLKNLGKDKPEEYDKFWSAFRRLIKQGVVTDEEQREALLPLLRYHSIQHPDKWVSLDEYIAGMKAGQEKIYYILGEDEHSLARSPHLEQFRKAGYDVLLMADNVDSFMLIRMLEYQDKKLANVSAERVEASPSETGQGEPETTQAEKDAAAQVMERFKKQLGERVAGVQTTDVLVDSPARLVDTAGSPQQELQRAYLLLDKKYEVPKKMLEINPRHAIIQKLAGLPEGSPVAGLIIEQVFEDALLIEGLHPDPAGMIERIEKIMKAALGESSQS